MPGGKQPLTVQHIERIIEASTGSSDTRAVYGVVQAVAGEVCGFELFTLLRYVDDATAVERVWSSDEAAYPVGGRKVLSSISMNHRDMDEGKVFLAPDRAAIRKTYPDHELIFSLGISAIMNAPVRHLGRRLGTLNLSGVEGGYDDADIGKARVLAGLLVPFMAGLR